MDIRVVVNGAQGRMGASACEAVRARDGLSLVGELDLRDDLQAALAQIHPDVVVDFTVASAALSNTRTILEAGCRPVVGTSGFTEADVGTLKALARARGLGGVIAPNFAPLAVLMMKVAADIARFFPDVEIIETHHEQKRDAPSGTSLKTAEMIARRRGEAALSAAASVAGEEASGARGTAHQGVPIHSIRLPGHLAHQRVVFGGRGESLTLQHDSISRDCFMPGVCLACERAPGLDELVYGLEHLL